MSSGRWQRVTGSGLLLAFPVALVVLLFSPGVYEPLGRTVRTLLADAFGGTETPWRYAVAGADRLEPGHPVFRADRTGALEPVAWVTGADGGAVYLRFAPGEAPAEYESQAFRLVSVGAPTGVGDSFDLAVPPDVAEELGKSISDRLERLFAETLKPELEKRLPAFLARVDPRNDPRAKEVFDIVGRAIVDRLRPLADEVTGDVVDELERHFDLLERLGLLWKVVRGDGRGLEGALRPVVERTLERWWNENSGRVIQAVGDGLAAEGPRWQEWLQTEVLQAAREELAEPILISQRVRLEREAEGAIRDVMRVVVEAPDGGFRVRFAAVLRSRLLEKDDPLLLLERVP